jgi:cytoskeletal protein RodZ
MFKELIIAIVLGGFLGFGVTGGLITLNRHRNPAPTQNSIPSPTEATPTSSQKNPPTPSVTPIIDTNQTSIKISSPITGSVVAQSEVEIIGNVPPNSLVVATLNTQSTTVTAKADGSFSTKVNLDAGYNLISVTAIDQNDNLSEIQINLTYSTAQF